MRRQSIRQQTAVLTGANIGTRAMGFFIRVTMSRALGPEALGIVEMASTVHMLWATPVLSGIPMAVSRFTAKLPDGKRTAAVHAGLSLVYRYAALLFPPLLLFMPVIAHLVGDERTLAALYFMIPCTLLLGVENVLNGFCHGCGNAWPSAISELTEQAVRMALTAWLAFVMPYWPAETLAAMSPVIAIIAMLSGLPALIIAVRGAQKGAQRDAEQVKRIRKDMLRESIPLSLSRLLTGCIRAFSTLLIPMRLVRSGMSAADATAGLGMLLGMVMPVIFLPAMCTGAISVVGMPAAARLAQQLDALGRMMRRALLLAAAIGMVCMTVIFCAAPLLSKYVYGVPELTALFRVCCPMVLVAALHQVLCAFINGLGMQKKTLLASSVGGGISLIMTVWLTAIPALRLSGAAMAMCAGQAITTGMNVWVILSFLRRQSQIT